MNSTGVLILGLLLIIIAYCYLVTAKKEKLGPSFLISPEPTPHTPPQYDLKVPVPRGSLKLTNEDYGFPFYRQYRPLNPYNYFKPYGPNQASMQNEIVYSTTPTYTFQQSIQGKPLQTGFGLGGGKKAPLQLPLGYSPPYTGFGDVPFYTSVNSFAPFPEINTPWEKVGLLTTVNPQNDAILNLYRRPIAPLQDLFDYAAQDKDGFIIRLKDVRGVLENGDIIPEVIGKESLGPWKVHNFVNDKYVWV